LRKYLRVIKRSLYYGLRALSIFKASFILSLLGDTFALLFSIVFFKAIYLRIENIGGWDYASVLFLLGTAQLIDGLYRFFFEKGIKKIPALIRKGTLDYALIKPLDPQFFLSFLDYNFQAISSVLIALYIIIYAAQKLSLKPNILAILLYLLSVINGVLILYAFAFYTVILSFKVTRVDALYALQREFFKYSNYPVSIFKNFLERLFFVFVIPVGIVANAPSLSVIFKKHALFFLAFLIALVHLLISRVLFIRSIKKYQSAGG